MKNNIIFKIAGEDTRGGDPVCHGCDSDYLIRLSEESERSGDNKAKDNFLRLALIAEETEKRQEEGRHRRA